MSSAVPTKIAVRSLRDRATEIGVGTPASGFGNSILVSRVPMQPTRVLIRSRYAPHKPRPLADVAGGQATRIFADGDVLLAKITPCFENGEPGIAANLDQRRRVWPSEYMVFRPGPTRTREWLRSLPFLTRNPLRYRGAEARMSGACRAQAGREGEFIDAYPTPETAAAPNSSESRSVSPYEAFDGIATAKVPTPKRTSKTPAPCSNRHRASSSSFF